MYQEYIPEVSFQDFYVDFENRWQQGEHAAFVGATGSGKTTLATELLDIRDYVVALAVKKRDDTLSLFRESGYRMLKHNRFFGLTIPYDATHIVIEMPPRSLRDTTQAVKVYKILDHVFMVGGWCCYVDDTGFLTGTLGMKRPLVVLLSQARSNFVSMVTAMVQPVSVTQGVPTEALRQIRHLFAWRYDDKPSIEAIARIGGVDPKYLAMIMRELGEHDFLYIHRGQITIVRNTWSS